MKLQKYAAATLLSAATVLSSPSLASSMTIEMFDVLAPEDQRDFVKFLAEASQRLLVEAGRRDLAEKVEELFRWRRGEQGSAGETQFEKQLTSLRAYLANMELTSIDGVRIRMLPGEVEGAFIGALIRNRIDLPRTFSKTLGQAARAFWPTRPLRTNAPPHFSP